MSAAFAQLGTAQQRLLRQLLRAPAGASVDALSAGIGITHNAVRQHLTSLMARGFVRRGQQSPTGGRPGQLFVLTEAGREVFPRRYVELAGQLLESMSEVLGPEQLTAMLEALGRRVADDSVGDLPTDPRQRIEAVAALMTELGYDAQAADTAPGQPREIVAYNCVFHHLAQRYPAICSFDLAFLETAGKSQVEHAECMARGGGACRFRFRDEQG